METERGRLVVGAIVSDCRGRGPARVIPRDCRTCLSDGSLVVRHGGLGECPTCPDACCIGLGLDCPDCTEIQSDMVEIDPDDNHENVSVSESDSGGHGSYPARATDCSACTALGRCASRCLAGRRGAQGDRSGPGNSHADGRRVDGGHHRNGRGSGRANATSNGRRGTWTWTLTESRLTVPSTSTLTSCHRRHPCGRPQSLRLPLLPLPRPRDPWPGRRYRRRQRYRLRPQDREVVYAHAWGD